MVVDDNGDLEVGEDDPADIVDMFSDHRREGFTAGTEHGQVGVLKNQAAHQGGDDDIEPVCAFATQRPVGNPFQSDADHRGQDHGQWNRQRQGYPARQPGCT